MAGEKVNGRGGSTDKDVGRHGVVGGGMEKGGGDRVGGGGGG